MSARPASHLAQPGRPARQHPAPASSQPPTELRVLGRPQLAERRRRRQARALALLSAAVLTAGLLAVAGVQALVDSQQVRLDNLGQQLSAEVAANQNLQLAHAELGSPGRLLDVAEHRLGMVVPHSLTYLSAVQPPAAPVLATAPAAPRGGPVARRPALGRSTRSRTRRR